MREPTCSYTPDDIQRTLKEEKETQQYTAAVAALCLDGLSHYLQDASEYLHYSIVQPNAPGSLSLTQTSPMTDSLASMLELLQVWQLSIHV